MVYNGKSYFSVGDFGGSPILGNPQIPSETATVITVPCRRSSAHPPRPATTSSRPGGKKVSINDAVMEPVSVIYIYSIYILSDGILYTLYIYYGSSIYILSDFMDVRPPQNCWRIPVWPQSLRGVLIILTHFLYVARSKGSIFVGVQVGHSPQPLATDNH